MSQTGVLTLHFKGRVTCQSGTEVTVKNILNRTVTVNLNNADTISLYYCELKFLKFIQYGRYDHC